MTGYWMLWVDSNSVAGSSAAVWHQVFHITAHICQWWSMAADSFVIGVCP